VAQAQIAAIILAAGESTRMGRPKALLPWAGTTLLAWQVAQMQAAGAGDVVVVLGHLADLTAEAIGMLEARIVVNEGYREGRASSVRAGAEAIDNATSAILILGVDQPRPSWVSRRLIERWRERQAPLVIPILAGRRDHPVLVDGRLLDELRRVREETLGLRAITERYRSAAEVVAIENSAVQVDLNTPAEYEAALAAFEAGAWQENVSKV
jgi:molybdenum cofactor cytidylyltransferase